MTIFDVFGLPYPLCPNVAIWHHWRKMEIKNGIMDFLSKISQTNLIDKLKLEIIIFPQLIDNLGTKGLTNAL